MKQMIVCPKCRKWWVDQIDKQPPGEFILVLDGTALKDFLCDSCVPASKIPKGSECSAVSNWTNQMVIGYYQWEEDFIKPFEKPEPMESHCVICHKKYPARFIQPMFFLGGYHSVDPECALAITNEIRGTNLTEFSGEMAQQLLEDFREWRAKHDK